MRIYSGLPKRLKESKAVLAIGVFDGLHRGHQAVLKRLRSLPGTPLVLTFDALPERIIAPDYAPASLQSLEAKLELLKASGVEALILVRFDKAFAAISAEAFAGRLWDLGIREIVVGADFVFGAHAAGNVASLRERGFRVHEVKASQVAGRVVSSTRIRSAISSGALKEASRLLGHPFRLRGKVVRGQQLGRTLGYPTANLDLEQEQLPKLGVWGGKARILGSPSWLPMIANLGQRPTVEGRRLVFEVHLLDFKGNLYGKRLEVEPQLYLRPEMRFENLEALQKQIRLDEFRFRRTRAFHSARRTSGASLG